MNRKHFEAIAAVLDDSMLLFTFPSGHAEHVHAMADTLASLKGTSVDHNGNTVNENFDREKFLKASGLQAEQMTDPSGEGEE